MHTVRHAYEKGSLPEYFLRPSKSRLAYQLLASFLSTRNSQSGTMLCTGLPYRRLHTPIFRKEKTYATRTQKTSTGEY